MSTLLVRNADLLVTMDGQRREIAGGGLFARHGVVEAVGPTAELPTSADEVIDARGQIVLPGLVNTHHHMFQTLTRALPAAQDKELFGWLQALYPVWEKLTPELLQVSTQLAMAELLLSGCTTSSDHLYLFPGACRLDDTLHAATEMGLRFHAARGSMSVGQSQGGLPPDSVVEDEAAILKDTQRLIETFHRPERFALQRIVVAPCSPFSVSKELMRDAALLARSFGSAHGVHLHTHLAENDSDIAYTREKFGCTPAEYAEQLGWLGPDVWHAHCVKLDTAGIAMFAATGTGVAHCPGSNMRLGSGIAPIRAMRDAGVPVALAVDGSASNDSGHLLAEARLGLLLQRVGFGATAKPPLGRPKAASPPLGGEARSARGALFPAREMLEIATLGGARVLGRDDIGALAPGMACDLVSFSLEGVATAGALHDPLAALLFCHPPELRLNVVQGRVRVRDGQLTMLELPALVARHNALAARLPVAA